jgi:phosphatidate cytidylyltransferase
VLKSNLVIRVITAVVAVPVLLSTLFLGPTWAWFALVTVASAIAAQELFAMTHPGDRVAQGLGILTTIIVGVVLYHHGKDPRALLSLMVGITLFGLLIPLWRLGQIPSAGFRIMSGIAGPLYVGLLITTSALLRRDHGPGFVLMTMMFAWFADTGGYFFGRFLGKRKLYEAVSPKKTRAGFVGALIGASFGGVLAHYWYLPEVPLAHALALAVAAGALGQLGDLVESLLKRSTGIKDSGSIIPGHGGILDRIDALLVVSGVVYVYALWR